MYNLEGKTAFVTGAGGKLGLGRAIALRLAAEGANVVVNDILPVRTGSADGSGLPDLVAEIEALGRSALAVVADVSQAGQVEQMVQQALQRFGQIDILVNNAGAPADAGKKRVRIAPGTCRTGRGCGPGRSLSGLGRIGLYDGLVDHRGRWFIYGLGLVKK